MKTSTKYKNYHHLILVFFFFISALSHAQLKNDFDPRFNETVNGDFTMIANNMVSLHVTDPYNGTGDNQDNNMVYVDIDGDASTFNSSRANFLNPAPSASCLTIKKVLLYWAASDFEPDTSNPLSENQLLWDFDDIKLMLPGETDYTTYDADEVLYRGRDDNGDGIPTDHFSNDPYICVKDITTLVTGLVDGGESPYGWYQVANVEGKIGNLQEPDFTTPTGVSGGWQIVFVYESPELPSKNISIYDGYAHVRNIVGQKDYEILIDGFQTVPAPQNVSVKVLMGALEGDRNLSGDKLQIVTAPATFVDLATDPTTPIRGPDNFFNSRITVDNANFPNREPNSENTLGFDAAVFQLNNPGNSIIGNDQTSATFRLTSNQETYGVYLLGLSVDVFEPNLGPIQVVTDADATPQAPGSTILGSFDVENKGNDNAQNVKIFSTLPPQLMLVEPVIGLPDGVDYSYDDVTGYLEFTVEDSYVEAGDPAIEDVEFNLIIRDECYFLEDSCVLSFGLEFTATYNGVINPVTQTTNSSSSVDACGVGNEEETIINVIQPTVDWATATGALDRNVQCNDASALSDAQALAPLANKCNLTIEKTPGTFDEDPSCPGTGTITNTFKIVNACNIIVADYVQTITISNTTPIVLPADGTETVDCIADADGSGIVLPT
ncbi:conserved repeat domain-containing protein, partial [Algibacter luteus]